MSRTLTFIFFIASCTQITLSQEPESCPVAYTEPPRVAAEVAPVPTPEEPSFVVPAQSLFEKDPNNFDDATSIDQCELFGGKISLVMSSTHQAAQKQMVSIKTSKEETLVSCTVSEIQDWDVGVRYQCPGFVWEQIGGDGSTEHHLKGKIAGKKVDLREFVSSSDRDKLYCSFPHAVYTNKLNELAKGALLTCPLSPEGYEASFAMTPIGESAITIMRHGDGDIGRSYAIPCEGAGTGFACKGTLWPLFTYRESAPEPDSGEKVSLNVQEKDGRYFLSGKINGRSLQLQPCMKFSW
jgi:hypothetical protein